jgi:ribulose-phosphate 3-epimerase
VVRVMFARYVSVYDMVLIAPSILAADLARLGEAIEGLERLGAPLIHVDVRDGHFRPEITAGQPVVRRVRQATKLELDVHLMVERPERYAMDFIQAGADRLALHAESTPDIYRALKLAREQHVKVGLALNPGTPLESGFSLLKELDYILILSGVPGKSFGETFDKVRAAVRERERQGLDLAIEVEDGIGPEEAKQLELVGADILVVGSLIFNGNNEEGEAIRQWVSRDGPGFLARRQETKPQVR